MKVSWGPQPVFLSWMEIRHRSYHDGSIAEINRQLAEKLGITHGDQVWNKALLFFKQIKDDHTKLLK